MKNEKRYFASNSNIARPLWFALLAALLAASCTKKDSPAQHSHPESVEIEYTCPMDPEVISDKPGSCPICKMNLVLKQTAAIKPVEKPEAKEVKLEALLSPTNEFVVSNIPVTSPQKNAEQIEIEALGNIAYDTRQVGSISARVAGRIEKLYVRYRFQKITKGQRLLDIYSPELMTAQQNLLFLLKNDPSNIPFIEAAQEKLRLLGLNDEQIKQLTQSGKPSLTIPIYSNYTGHVHEAANGSTMPAKSGAMNDLSLLTEELTLKEGMYLQKGESIFTVYNPDRAWAILSIYGESQGLVKTGNLVQITPETAPEKAFGASIDFIEPFFRNDSKTLSARVYFNNSQLKIPIGSQVKATITGNTKATYWLPSSAVLSLGLDAVVFRKTQSGFKTLKVTTGISYQDYIQVLNGISSSDTVAINAQYLMDSESFIKIKK